MDIRIGDMADRFGAVALAREFHAEARAPFAFDPARAEAVYKAHLGHADRLCMVAADMDGLQGILLAQAGDHPFGALRIAVDTIWYVRATARGRGRSRSKVRTSARPWWRRDSRR